LKLSRFKKPHPRPSSQGEEKDIMEKLENHLYQITLISVFILFYGKLLIIFCHVSLPYPPTPSPKIGEGEP